MFRSWHGLFLLFSSTMMLMVMASMAYSGKIARENAEMVRHTNVVIGTFFQLRAVVAEAESAALAYALLGSGPAPVALSDAPSASARLLDTLDKLTADSGVQQERLRTLAEGRRQAELPSGAGRGTGAQRGAQ